MKFGIKEVVKKILCLKLVRFFLTLFHKLAGFKKYSSNKMDLVTDEAGTVIRIDLDQEPSKQVAVMVKEGTQMRATHCAGSAGCIMYGSATSATNRRRLNEVGRVPETFR